MRSKVQKLRDLEDLLRGLIEERRRACGCESCQGAPGCECEACGALLELRLSSDEASLVAEALHTASHSGDLEAALLRERAKLARARSVLRETRNAGAALRAAGVTHGREGKGKRDGPSDVQLADLYVKLRTSSIAAIGRTTDAAAALEFRALLAERVPRATSLAAISVPAGALDDFELGQRAPMDDESALCEVARYASVGRRTAWNRLSSENKRRRASGEPTFTLPNARGPRLGGGQKKRRNIGTRRAR